MALHAPVSRRAWQWLKRRARNLRILRWLRSDRYLLLHAIEAPHVKPAGDDDGLRCNRLEDLALFEQTERWLAQQAFAAEARQRIADGMRLYTAVDGGRLVHYGWLVPRQAAAWLPYVRQHFVFPEGTAVLYNAYTHPAARGTGLHERSMRRRMYDAARLDGTRWVYTAIESHNLVSRRVAQRAGFRCVGVLFERVRLGRAERGCMAADDYLRDIEHHA